MADNFTAEKVSSADQIFATDQRASDSAHFPIGKLSWGALNTFNITDTSTPLPVQLISGNSGIEFNIGNQSTVFTQTGYSTIVTVTDLSTATKIQIEPVTSSANRTFVDNNSAHPVFVRGLGDSTVPVSGTVSVSNIASNDTVVTVTNIADNDTLVTVTGLVAPVGSSRGESSSTPLFVTGPGADTAHAIVVRGMGSTNVVVEGTVTVSNIDGNDTTVTVAALTTASKVQIKNDTGDAIAVQGLTDSHVAITNDSGNAVFVRGLTNSIVDVLVTNTNITVTNIADNDTTVTVTNGLLKEAPSSAGGLTATTILLSSAEQDFMTAVGRLFHISVSNESSDADVWFRVFTDDAGGVTLGDTVPVISQVIPQQGGREMDFGPYGVAMSSGMSIAAAATANDTVHDTPSTTAYLTAYFAPST